LDIQRHESSKQTIKKKKRAQIRFHSIKSYTITQMNNYIS